VGERKVRKPRNLWVMWWTTKETDFGPDRRTFSPTRAYTYALCRDAGYTTMGGVVRVEVREVKARKSGKGNVKRGR